MACNRLLYLGLLILAAVFYFASSLWFAWLLVALLLALPAVTLLVSLPAMLTCRLDAVMAETVEQGEHAVMRLRLHSWGFLPLPEVQLRVNLRTRDRQKDLRYLSRLSRAGGVLALPTEVCGYLAPEFRRGRVYDALGLFRLPLRMPKLPPMAILPPEQIPAVMPQMDVFLLQHMKPKPGGGYAEHHELRAYRPGDPVKDIHWKLSLKTDELVVREAQEPVRRRVVLALRTPRGARNRTVGLGNLRYLSRWLLNKGILHETVWMEGQTLRDREIRTEADVLEVLRAACLAGEDTEDLPWPLPIQADWICPVGPEGGQQP